MTFDDMFAKAAQQLHAQLFAIRDPNAPRFDHVPQNDLHPDASQLAFRLQILEQQNADLHKRLANVEGVIRQAQKNGRSG